MVGVGTNVTLVACNYSPPGNNPQTAPQECALCLTQPPTASRSTNTASRPTSYISANKQPYQSIEESYALQKPSGQLRPRSWRALPIAARGGVAQQLIAHF